jgi:DNA-binding MarR family transcriptional regulator
MKESMGAQPLDDDVRYATDHLRRIVRALRVSARSAEKATGLSGAQVFVLQKLAEAPATSLGELALRTATDQSSVSVVVSRLVGRRLAVRQESKKDARRVEIRLTEAGRRVLRRSPKAMQDQLLEALGRMPSASRRRLAVALGELVAQMNLDGEVGMFFEEEPSSTRSPSVRRPRARA